jgi:predicted acyl esterase
MSPRSLRLYFARTIGSEGAGRLGAYAPPAQTFVEQRIDFKDRSDVDWLPPQVVVSQSLDTHNAIAFVSDPAPRDMEVNGLVRASLSVQINRKDFDFNLRLYELTPSGQYIGLTVPYQQRASLLNDRSHRHLLTPGVPQTLELEMGPVSRLFRPGSRLVVLLGVNKERDAEVNYGSGKEVSTESIADAGEPLSVKWMGGSSIDVPLAGEPPAP